MPLASDVQAAFPCALYLLALILARPAQVQEKLQMVPAAKLLRRPAVSIVRHPLRLVFLPVQLSPSALEASPWRAHSKEEALRQQQQKRQRRQHLPGGLRRLQSSDHNPLAMIWVSGQAPEVSSGRPLYHRHSTAVGTRQPAPSHCRLHLRRAASASRVPAAQWIAVRHTRVSRRPSPTSAA